MSTIPENPNPWPFPNQGSGGGAATQIHLIADKGPDFPCWLWHVGYWQWERHADSTIYDLMPTAYHHWHLDQPSVPAVTPIQPESGTVKSKVPPGYTAEELDSDNPYNAWMCEDAPAPVDAPATASDLNDPRRSPIESAPATSGANVAEPEQGDATRLHQMIQAKIQEVLDGLHREAALRTFMIYREFMNRPPHDS